MAVMACVFVSSIAQARTKEIYVKTDEDRSGYGDVVERHETEGENSYHSLICEDPGLSACVWQFNPCGRLIEYAKDQIGLGILSGQHQIQENLNIYTVVWGIDENEGGFIKETQNLNDPLN